MSDPGEIRAHLQAEVEAAVLAAVERAGKLEVDQSAIVKPFLSRGAGRSTVYRWVGAILKDGRAYQHLARAIKEAAEERARGGPSAAEDISKSLPAVVRPEHIVNAGAIPIIARLNECVETAQNLMTHARTEDGRIRNAKLLIAASEHLRRCLDTAARIADQMRAVNQVDRFHAAIIEEVSRESPECAERIQRRLSTLAAEWGG